MYFNHYSKKGFWDDYYTEARLVPFDWLQDYRNLKDIINMTLSKDGKDDKVILDVGCGTSTFLEFMYEEGYQSLVGIDFSEKVIEVMKQRYSSINQSFECKIRSLCDGRD